MALVEIDRVISHCIDVKEIISESELQSCSGYERDRDLLPFVRLRADRALSVESKSGLQYISLEYERFVKSKQRIESKLRDYYQRKRIPAVLYVCESQKVMRALAKVDSEISKESGSKLFFSLFSSVIKSDEKVTFSKTDGKKINFKMPEVAG